IFLGLLYNSSAALVLYWTMNNIFSVAKNWLLQKANKENRSELLDDKNDSLSYIIIQLFIRFKREVIITIVMWASYLLIINKIIDSTLIACFSSIIAALIAILLLDTLILIIAVKAYKAKKKGYSLIIGTTAIIAISHLSIIYARFSSLTAYDYFRIVIVLQVGYLISYLIINWRKLKLPSIDKSTISVSDITIYLIFLFPLINYPFANLSHFETTASWLSFFSILIILPTIALLVINLTFKQHLNKQYTFIIFIAIVTTFYSVPYLSSYFKLTAEGNILHHLVLLITLTSIFIFMYYKYKKIFAIATLVLCSTAAINGISSTIKEGAKSVPVIEETAVYSHLENKKMLHKPDIYLLIYDAYVNEKQMEYYGIDNKPQMQFLREKNFTFYEDSYTLWMGSLGSMSRVLDMDNIAQGSEKKYRDRIANSTLTRILKKNNYKTHYILHPYFYNGCKEFGVDYVYPEIDNKHGIKPILLSVFLGEFKLAIEVETDMAAHAKTCSVKRDIMCGLSAHAKFLYSHSLFPSHSTLSGRCLPNEKIRYTDRLSIANQEMTEDINSILANDNDAIIIIAGDHGAYLEGDCNYLENYKKSAVHSAELADRFGLFLAIRYPNNNYIKYDQDINILQDVFFSILADLFEDKDLLEYKLDAETYKVNEFIPQGAIKNGIINYGPDMGKPLYWDMKTNITN
ncbi:MAG: hypothetical protein PF444_06765, partial [Bacteroidales bacterium]|nr:hypothetical protein [Bacteroidales bacterium]